LINTNLIYFGLLNHLQENTSRIPILTLYITVAGFY
jgi:hypothetical protein